MAEAGTSQGHYRTRKMPGAGCASADSRSTVGILNAPLMHAKARNRATFTLAYAWLAKLHDVRDAGAQRSERVRKAREGAFDKDGRRCIAISGNISDPGFDTALEAA